ncbi:(Fe-S)-binding protein, partial [bacterium]|nr:(Fe-S)-binding protein [bacterium]
LHILERCGIEVVYPKNQTCCGQPSFNSGYWKETSKAAEHFIQLFQNAETVVTPSGSCAAMVKKHYADLELSQYARSTFEQLQPRIFELSQFLVDELKITDLNVKHSYQHKVAYHTSCHGHHDLGIRDQAKTLLKNVPGIELIDIPDRKQCCGFGGTFSVKFPEVSVAMGEDKLEAVQKTGAGVITATDDSCLMHLNGLITKRKLPLRTIHYARILAGDEVLV